ncbi:RrF2 family transcriptional regulator [Fervidobacterium thailandense]|uniref:Rrf2 family transcriptional regulator n=1 Tax=Fervidobacterium thailandense TaxID=1008305 RepID=A0A1E3G0G2_9BACT|nr:Rrf2 family transcriptional regulator [Fervidobacterium thailandense]ODN29741.1 Rrf2 family transcriptional regulator [Fervidobacterium thailandense]
MAITMKSEYAIKIMLLIGLQEKRVTAREIVSKCREKLPLEFTEKILADLTRHGLLKAYRGRSGGYELSKKLSEITIYDIVSSVDNPQETVRCFVKIEDDQRGSPETCAVNSIWESITKKIEETLKSVTLEKLVNDYKAMCEKLEGNPELRKSSEE